MYVPFRSRQARSLRNRVNRTRLYCHNCHDEKGGNGKELRFHGFIDCYLVMRKIDGKRTRKNAKLSVYWRPIQEQKQTGLKRMKRLQRGTASASGIAVWHDVDRDRAGLIPAWIQGRADLRQEPLLEFRCGLNRATADDEGVGVEGGDHLIEEQSESLGLCGEKVAR